MLRNVNLQLNVTKSLAKMTGEFSRKTIPDCKSAPKKINRQLKAGVAVAAIYLLRTVSPIGVG